MSVILHSAACEAMEVYLTRVEVCFMRGFGGVHLIGNIGEITRAGVERAKAALEARGYVLPQKRITISVSPGHERINSSHLDLAMAMALFVLLQENKGLVVDMSRWVFAAELGLDGRLRSIKNAVSFGVAAIEAGMEGMIVAEDNQPELNALQNLEHQRDKPITILPFRYLEEVISWAESGFYRPLIPMEPQAVSVLPAAGFECFDDMILSSELTLLAKIVAVGRHSLMMYGSPGTGKSMFSARLNSIFPSLDPLTHLDALKIHSSYASQVDTNLILGIPSYRCPHHQASAAAILGIPETPGEISLAHGGILFLDEFAEFRRDLIESLREPLETGYVRVSRAKRKVSWVAKPILIAACNLCPCGWFGSQLRECNCSTLHILNYRRKLSGPILDRIDLHVNMPENTQKRSHIFNQKREESQTETLRSEVAQSYLFGTKRNRHFGALANSSLKAQDMQKASGLEKREFDDLVDTHVPKSLGFRALLRSLRVARTLADLEQRDQMKADDLQKALTFQADFASRARGDFALGMKI